LGDSVIELDPDATRVLGNYTPADNLQLKQRDLDLGSTSPVLLGGGSLAQGGKDKLISLLSINAIGGGLRIRPMNCRSCPRRNECCLPPRRCDITAPRPGYSPPPPINGGGAAWTFRDGKLVQMWNNSNGSTIPIVAGGLLYIM